MLQKSNSTPTSTPQLNITKYTTNPNQPSTTMWPPSTAVIDNLILKLKAKHGDMEANWEQTILNFKKELETEQQQQQLKATSSNNNNININNGIERREKGRAKFSVPLSRREMEKDFEDMGERRLPRKPKKRPKSIQNQLDTLFPGLWLTEIHADLYRVSETKKR
ncbi:uncharacterized protein LOC143586743 isoform X2 [Bidens hawaiensis]|uniref:uncharacterized protein LOC143586743 isoform X2 n=1 Tax=Bidens hawaiensis TaxID=980011 RepID=UPI004049ECC3